MKVEFYLLLTYSNKYHLGISAPWMHEVNRRLHPSFYYSPLSYPNEMGFNLLGLTRNSILEKWKLSRWGVLTILASNLLENKKDDWNILFEKTPCWLTGKILSREVARCILSEDFQQATTGDLRVAELLGIKNAE